MPLDIRSFFGSKEDRVMSKEPLANTQEQVSLSLTIGLNREHTLLKFSMMIFIQTTCDDLTYFKPCPGKNLEVTDQRLYLVNN